jgi:hypothetical protein
MRLTPKRLASFSLREPNGAGPAGKFRCRMSAASFAQVSMRKAVC